ncbi:MAG: site-2 protease family protein [Planctomycetes bacterium]|nr:site-2 protease family protein [Planctomycetota bacterium]
MNESIRLGSIFGIEIKLHWSMPLLLLVFLFGLSGSMGFFNAALLLLALESIVLLHELGHSLVAKSYGLQVIDITFWPLGGMARMSRIPEDTKIEATIALAGPAVNLLLALVTMPVLAFAGDSSIGQLAWIFVLMNLTLGGFNLLPAFPMDGGRVLRALLARDGDWLRATERAVRIGRWVALAMAILGFSPYGSFMLVFIAGFVWISGQKELMAMRMRHTGSPFGMGGLEEMLRRAAGDPGGAPPARDASDERDTGGAPWTSSAHRPQAAGDGHPHAGRGWSDEEIAKLEGFHGRLRSFKDAEDA